MRTGPALVAIVIAAGTLLIAVPGAVRAQPVNAARVPPLSLPIDCTPGDDCFVQKYVDVDLTSGVADHTCGTLTSDGHNGTDFRIMPGNSADVLAAAPGTVKAVRDGMPDNLFDGPLSVPSDRACGNGVLIDHGDGVETLACHMTPGSVRVAVGDRVARSDVLGRVGASGLAGFRHVHFHLSVDGETVDPFTGLEPGVPCGTQGTPLWQDATWKALTDTPRTAVIAAGFADSPVTIEAIEADRLPAIEPDAKALVAYGLAFGAEAGDSHRLTLSGPGIDIAEESPQERAQAQAMRFAGRRMSDGLQPGTYTMSYAIVRDGTVIDSFERKLTLE